MTSRNRSSATATLLVIDDEPLILDCFRYLFPEGEVRLATAASAEDGISRFSEVRPDVVMLDIGLPDLSGMEAFRRLRELDARVPVILMTGRGTAATAIEAMRLGAFDYLPKPLDPDILIELLQRAFDLSRMMRVPATVPGGSIESSSESESGDILIGQCPAMQSVYKAIGKVASQDVTVLILGESGTGKELVARAIYHYSRRADKAFRAINCAAIAENLLESELFGHEKGSFTGADRRRIGRFEQCHEGTLFLDEVGEMSPMLQSKMLRLLQEGEFERVGGNESLCANVRIIAATNRDLEARVASGAFRGDLYYRLNVFSIHLPPLRERGDDLLLLARHFLQRFSRDFQKDVRDFSPETIALLRGYSWPGNIRELQSVVKQVLLEAVGPVIVPAFLPPALRSEPLPEAQGPAGPAGNEGEIAAFIRQRLEAGSTNLHAEVLERIEGVLLPEVLRHTGGNLSQASRILGITRPTLRAKLTEAGLAVERTLTELGETVHGGEPS